MSPSHDWIEQTAPFFFISLPLLLFFGRDPGIPSHAPDQGVFVSLHESLEASSTNSKVLLPCMLMPWMTGESMAHRFQYGCKLPHFLFSVYVPSNLANLFIALPSIIHSSFMACKDGQILTWFVCVADGRNN